MPCKILYLFLQVTLEAEVTNKGALALYGRLGFIRSKRLFRYYLNGVDAFRLKLLFPRPDPLLSINSNESHDHSDHPQDVYSELHHNVQWNCGSFNIVLWNLQHCLKFRIVYHQCNIFVKNFRNYCLLLHSAMRLIVERC